MGARPVCLLCRVQGTCCRPADTRNDSAPRPVVTTMILSAKRPRFGWVFLFCNGASDLGATAVKVQDISLWYILSVVGFYGQVPSVYP